MKRSKQAVILAGILSLAGQIVQAEDAAPPLSVDQRLSILERKYENDQEAATAKTKDGSSVTAGKDGFQLKSNDGSFTLKLSGYAQTDYREYLNDHGNTAFTDQFLLRRVRPIFSGTLNKVTDFRIMADLANGGGTGGSTLLQDAYVEWKYWPAAKVRVGKFKPPVGLERLQSGSAIQFVERALPTNLVPNRDTGVQLSGDFKEGLLSYQLGVFNGVVDGSSGETDTTDGKDYAGRLFVQPFKAASSEWWNGLGLGVSGSVGDQFGTAAATNLISSYKTNGQQDFFKYQAGTFANGRRTRISPQGYWYTSHFGILGEYVASSQEVTRVSTTTLTHVAWQVAASYVLTGERPSFNGIKPRKPFDPDTGGWGALELTGRYSVFRVDQDAFNAGFAVPNSWAQRATAWTAGLNWYLNSNLKVVSNYESTSFVGGAAGGLNRPSEHAILSRVQWAY